MMTERQRSYSRPAKELIVKADELAQETANLSQKSTEVTTRITEETERISEMTEDLDLNLNPSQIEGIGIQESEQTQEPSEVTIYAESSKKPALENTHQIFELMHGISNLGNKVSELIHETALLGHQVTTQIQNPNDLSDDVRNLVEDIASQGIEELKAVIGIVKETEGSRKTVAHNISQSVLKGTKKLMLCLDILDPAQNQILK